MYSLVVCSSLMRNPILKITGLVTLYVMSDNANSAKRWHDTDAAFSGTAYSKLQHFQANVASILWQQLENLLSISDALARIVDTYSKPKQASAVEQPQQSSRLHQPLPTNDPSPRSRNPRNAKPREHRRPSVQQRSQHRAPKKAQAQPRHSPIFPGRRQELLPAGHDAIHRQRPHVGRGPDESIGDTTPIQQ